MEMTRVQLVIIITYTAYRLHLIEAGVVKLKLKESSIVYVRLRNTHAPACTRIHAQTHTHIHICTYMYNTRTTTYKNDGIMTLKEWFSV